MASPNSHSTSPANVSTPIPFPQPDGVHESPTGKQRARTSTNVSSASSRIRSASIKLMEADPPLGMWAATGSVASKAPSLVDIRRGSYGSEGWDDNRQREYRRGSQGSNERPDNKRKGSSGKLGVEPFPALTEERPSFDTRERVRTHDDQNDVKEVGSGMDSRTSRFTDKSEETAVRQPLRSSGQYANGYIPPPKLPWTKSLAVGLKAFWKWFLTIPGFLITIYALNVVAWGGMLFLLLCNAAPRMCTPTCDDINSPRRIWVEIDSQILNALFCVTGFGLAPWRFRDLYWWTHWRLGKNQQKKLTGIRRLAAYHRGWWRLVGSENLPEHADATNVDPNDLAVPIPVSKIPDPPPTGFRASPTISWKMDFVLWMNASNTFFQIVLCFYMWHYDRIQRPSWATGLFVALGCIVAGVAGIMIAVEGKRIKKVEGVPMRKEDQHRLTDAETHSAQDVPLVNQRVPKA